MFRYNRHIFAQSAGVRALFELLVANKQQVPNELPAPFHEITVDAPSNTLIDDFVRFSGGDPSNYQGVVPPHLFCQWSLPAMLTVASGLPYPATKVINAGCQLRISSPIPRGERLTVAARLASVQVEERRVRLAIDVNTQHAGTALLEAQLRVVVPLPAKQSRTPLKQSRTPSPKKQPELVPAGARELLYRQLSHGAGADFARLTGDFNPIHWLTPYAKAVGFRHVILHGFASFSLTFEALVRHLFSGDARRVTRLEARFVRPLVLPARVGVYVLDDRVVLGDAFGGAVYLSGSYG